jgi:hypothetical protein
MGLLELSSKGKMRVLPAAQLLSGTTAEATRYLIRRKLLNNPSAPTLATVISAINDWFDVVNSREGSQKTGIKGPFGSCLDKQEEILNQVKMHRIFEIALKIKK